MNNRDAQFILSAFRPGGQDTHDPRFADALSQARSDPALAHWLEEQSAFDRAFADALQSTPVPADLYRRILAGSAASGPRPAFRSMRVFAIAAVLAFAGLIAFLALPKSRHESLRDWQREALNFLTTRTQPSDLDHLSSSLPEIRSWLAAHGAPVTDQFPGDLSQRELVGCKILSSGGRTVTIICFRRDDGKLVHLVMTDCEALPGLAAIPRFQQSGQWATVSWVRGDRAYMLATVGTEAVIRPFL